MKNHSVAVIGAGKLGEPIIRRSVEDKIYRPEDIFISRKDKAKIPELVSKFPGCKACACNCQAILEAQIIILAVKPQDLDEVAAELKGKISREQVVFSLVTRKRMAELSAKFGVKKIFRASTSILLDSKSATTYWLHTSKLNRMEQAFCLRIVESWGESIKAKDEKELDLAIAACGTTPAFQAQFMKFLAEAYVEMGWPRQRAEEEILKSCFATCAKCLREKISPSDIVAKVKTPGGITAAGLEVLEGCQKLINEAIKAVLDKIKKL